MAQVTKLDLSNVEDHSVWAETPVERRIGRYNKETNTTMYAVASSTATEEDKEAFLKDYPDFEPIP